MAKKILVTGAAGHTGRGKHAPIAASDQARVITAILENPEPHKGKIYPLYGPVEMDHPEIARQIGLALGKPMRYQQVPFEEFAEAASARLGANPVRTQHLREVTIDYQNGVFAGTNNLVEEIGGRPPMDIQTFVREHRKAYE